MTSKFFSFFKPGAANKRTEPSEPANPLQERIEAARALHLQGKLDAALAQYGEILTAHPDNAEAHYRRANVLKDQGALEPAVAGYDRAIALKADYAHALCNRAVVLGQLQRLPEALASYDRAVALDPNDALAQCNRAMLLNATGQKDAALAGLDAAIAGDARFFPAHFARAALLQERKQWLASLASYDQAVALDPEHAAAHYNRATVLKQLERWADALAGYDRAIACNAGFARAYSGRGAALSELNRLPEALDSFAEALKRDPQDATAYSGRGIALRKLGRYEEALASYDKAIAINPDYADGHFNRGAVLAELGDVAGALASYRRTLSLQPELPEAHLNLAFALLKSGDYATGWVEHEWRWRVTRGLIAVEVRDFNEPLWLGESDIAGKTILLYGEQGLGDSLQFCRFATSVARLGARVILELPRALVALCSALEGVAQVIARGDPLPHFDVQCPLMSLPLALKTSLATIPAASGYLASDPEKVAAWKERLGPKRQPRVGLCWSGSVAARSFTPRSFPLAKWVPYLQDDFEYFCLQTEITEADRKTLAEHAKVRQFEVGLMDFRGTAALYECLDLIITADTSMAHLGGALGKKTWVLVPFDCDWRWLTEREDSPWYSAVRIFRQTSRGDWDGLLRRVVAESRIELNRHG